MIVRLLAALGWRRRFHPAREPLLVEQWRAWAEADPQIPPLTLPPIKPLKARKVIRLQDVGRRSA